jgi:hypothetical protein
MGQASSAGQVWFCGAGSCSQGYGRWLPILTQRRKRIGCSRADSPSGAAGEAVAVVFSDGGERQFAATMALAECFDDWADLGLRTPSSGLSATFSHPMGEEMRLWRVNPGWRSGTRLPRANVLCPFGASARHLDLLLDRPFQKWKVFETNGPSSSSPFPS